MIDWQWAEVDELEYEAQWDEAKDVLVQQWTDRPDDVKTTIRLGFLCWYVLVEAGPLAIESVDFAEYEYLLQKMTSEGFLRFHKNEVFLWCFGYMMSLFPVCFGDEKTYESKGILMLKRAAEKKPDEPIYELTYLGTFVNTDERYKKVLKQVSAKLNEQFKGKGIMSTYFREIWRHEE